MIWQSAAQARYTNDSMAYRLGDAYRPLRAVMRLNGAVFSLVGLLFLLARQSMLVGMGVLTGESGWVVRLAGAGLVAIGLFLLLTATEPSIEFPSLVTMLVANALVVIVLLVAYFQGELAGLNWLGRLVLIAVFLLCLVGFLAPLRYFQAEFRSY